MRLLKLLFLASITLIQLTAAASANTLSLVQTAASGSPASLTVSYDLVLDTSTGTAAFYFSASAPGATSISGTLVPFLIGGPGTVLTPISGDPAPGIDSATGWYMYASPPTPAGVAPGSYTFGTLTITAAAGTVLEFGVLGGAFDSIVDQQYVATTVTNAVVVVTPEPGTVLLMGIGIAGFAVTRRRR